MNKIKGLHIIIVLILGLLHSLAALAQPVNNNINWDVKIVGNEAYPEIVLKNIIAIEGRNFIERITTLSVNIDNTGYSEIEAERDRIRLERFYQRRGFPDIDVDYEIIEIDPGKENEIVFSLDEGRPILINKVEVRINASEEDSADIFEERRFNRVMRRQAYRINRRFEAIKEAETEGSIIDALNNQGYFKAEASVTFSVDTVNYAADVRIEINPGTRTYINEVIVNGNSVVDDNYYTRETGIYAGDLFSERNIQNAQRELYNHHMIKFVTTDVQETDEEGEVDLVFNVNERDLRSFQFSAGIGIDRDINNEFLNAVRLLRTQVSWTYRNAAKRGERFRTILIASGFEQSLRFDYLFPYVFNTKSSFSITPGFEHRIEPSFEIFSVGIQNTLSYEYTRQITATIGYEFTVNDEFSRNAQESLPDSVLDYNVSSILITGFYRDRVFANREGWIIQPFIEISSPLGEADFSFQKLSVDVRRLERVTDNLSVAARIRMGAINYSGQDSLPQNIRFFNGGTSRVRGYSRDQLGPKRPVFFENGQFDQYLPIGGRARYNFTVEVRQRIDELIRGFEVTAFLDGGAVWKSFGGVNGIDFGETRYGAGGGLRYRSPIGPVRIEFARKMNPTDADLNIFNGQDFGNFWDRNRIHFSVGTSF